MQRDLDLVVLDAPGISLTAQPDGTSLVGALGFSKEMTGFGATAAMATAALDVPAALLCRVGDDDLGHWMLERWDAVGLYLDFTTAVGGRNALTMRGGGGPQGGGGRPTRIHWWTGCAPMTLDATDLDAVPWRRTRLLLVTGYTQAMPMTTPGITEEALARAREHGVTTVYAPLYSPALWQDHPQGAARRAFEGAAALADVVVLGAPLASGRLVGEADAEAVGAALVALGVTVTITHHGGRVVVHDSSDEAADDGGSHWLAGPAHEDEAQRAQWLGRLLAHRAGGRTWLKAASAAGALL